MATTTTADIPVDARLAHTITPDVETASDAYASRFAGPVGAFLLGRQEAIVRAFLARNPGGARAILDVGGGHGQLMPAFLEGGHSVTVFGSSDESHQRLKSRYPGNPRIEYAEGDLYRLPFEDSSFDVVTAFRLIPHLTEPERFVAELARVARREVIFDFAPKEGLNSLSPLLFSVKKKIEKNTRLYFTHHSRDISKILRGLGFSQVEIVKQFAVPMGIHRLLKSPPVSSALERSAAAVGLTPLLGSPAIVSARKSG